MATPSMNTCTKSASANPRQTFTERNTRSQLGRYSKSAAKARGESRNAYSSSKRHKMSLSHPSSGLGRYWGREARGEAAVANSLDFSLVPSVHESGVIHAVTMGQRRTLSSDSKSPGPGRYNVRVKDHTQSAVFGSESRYEQMISRYCNRTYISIYSADPVRPKSAAYSFCGGVADRSKSTARSGEFPGPGYYNCHYREKNVPAPCFVTTGEVAVSKMSKTEEGPYCDMTARPSPRKDGKRGFQRFSTVARFFDQTSRTGRYKRLLSKPVISSVQNLVDKNVNEAWKDKRPEMRKKRIQISKQKLESMIRAVKIAKQRLEQEEEDRIKVKEETLRRRVMVSHEKLSFAKLRQTWTALLTMQAWMRTLARKLARRKEVCKRTDKLMRVLFVCLWSVGKLIRHSKIRRHNKMMKFMKRIVNTKRGLWQLRRRIRYKKLAVGFVAQYEAAPTMLIFIKFVLSRILLIQKWYRRCYVKKLIMLSLMNIQWSAIEFVVLRVRSSRGEVDGATMAQEINTSIKEGRVSNAVPVPVRLKCLKEALNKLNQSHAQKIKAYCSLSKELRERAEYAYELDQVERMLRGFPREKFVFKPPPPPVYRIFIRRNEMAKLIKTALLNRVQWDSAKAGKTAEDAAPIIRVCKDVAQYIIKT